MSDAGAAVWAAVGGGLVVGLASLGTTWLSHVAAAQREAQRFQHEAKMANEQRRQQRIEGTYLRLLAVVNEGWALMERDAPDKEAPDYRAVHQLVEGILSELDAFGSDDTRPLRDMACGLGTVRHRRSQRSCAGRLGGAGQVGPGTLGDAPV